jgi:hypothetical protein
MVVTVERAFTASESRRRWTMPVLIVALVALLVFGVIGALLLAAQYLERKKSRQPGESKTAVGPKLV